MTPEKLIRERKKKCFSGAKCVLAPLFILKSEKNIINFCGHATGSKGFVLFTNFYYIKCWQGEFRTNDVYIMNKRWATFFILSKPRLINITLFFYSGQLKESKDSGNDVRKELKKVQRSYAQVAKFALIWGQAVDAKGNIYILFFFFYCILELK